MIGTGPKHIAIALELSQDFDHHQGLYRGILRYARERGGWRCTIDEHPGYQPPGRKRAVQNTYDGVIARAWPTIRDHIERLGVPWVNLLYQTREACPAGVYSDGDQSGRLAAEHLIDRGFRRLVSVFQPDHQFASEVAAGFKRCVLERGLACEEVHVEEGETLDPTNWVQLEAQVDRLFGLLAPPTAVFVETPLVARLLAQHSAARGLHVPLELAIVCQRDLTPTVDVSPSISALQYNHERVGYKAAQLLDRFMAGQAGADLSLAVPPLGLVARESTDYFVTEDAVVARALRHISARITEPLYTEDVAEAVGVSARGLHDRFHAALGRSVAQEVRRLRLALAQRMLLEHDRSVAEVAALTGFGDGKSLAQVFRRELGTTPTAFRNQQH